MARQNAYEAPRVNAFGPLHHVTGSFGSADVEDQAFGPDDEPIDNPTGFETGSVDGVFGPK